MSSKSKDSSSEIEQDESGEADGTSQTAGAEASSQLTIALPDGSTNVADAIATNREMLSNPEHYNIATEEDITHLSEAMESLSSKVEQTTRKYNEGYSTLTELQDLVKQQQRQINELQVMVTSLADILGTEAEWNTFDEE